jgi:hypothetical protein
LLTNVTITANTATPPFATAVHGRFQLYPLTLRNTIIDGTCESVSSFVSAGGNIESPGDTCALDAASDQTNVSNAQLALLPLHNNGGPTRTHALASGSVAIDHGVGCPPPDADQRGVARPQGPACDAGAVEWSPPQVPALGAPSILALAAILLFMGAWHGRHSRL